MNIEWKPVTLLLSTIGIFLTGSGDAYAGSNWINPKQEYGASWSCGYLSYGMPQSVYDTCNRCYADGGTLYLRGPSGFSESDLAQQQAKCDMSSTTGNGSSGTGGDGASQATGDGDQFQRKVDKLMDAILKNL